MLAEAENDKGRVLLDAGAELVPHLSASSFLFLAPLEALSPPSPSGTAAQPGTPDRFFSYFTPVSDPPDREIR